MKQSGNKFAYSKCDRAQVTGVQFCILSEKEIDNWTSAEISKFDAQSKEEESGINDSRLGVTQSKKLCKTCKQTIECPGHFGRIKLERKIFHINFMNTIKQILLCICHQCGALRKPKINLDSNGLPKNDTEKAKYTKYQEVLNIPYPKRRLNEMYKMLGKVNECWVEGCKAKLYTTVTVENFLDLYLKRDKNGDENQKSDKKIWTAEETYNVLSKIPEQTAQDLLGIKGVKGHHYYFTHPKDLILSRLLVSPPQVRPAIEMSSTQTCQDELTKCYEKIIQYNNEIREGNVDIYKHTLEIQSIVARMMDNDKPKLKALKIKNKVIKSYSQRLKGKEGRFRQNLMGKRVDFSARSVISPDANLALDELGVPRSIADNLTVPEIVNQQNIVRIKQLWELGKIKQIMKPNRQKQVYETFDAIISRDTHNIIEEHINDGVIVERALQDGDYVLFNRQPTLHKMSMMGHRVHILPFSTFRLNLSVCTPYNADFDGDEMNLHVPQSYETRAELKYLCHVPRQVVAPKANKPVMGIVQDSLLGVSMFTLRDTFLNQAQVMNIVMWVDNWEGELPMPAILKPKPLWTGKQIMSLIIPEKMTMTRTSGKSDDDKWFSSKDESIYIYKGELLQGYMTKGIVGDGPGGLVHLIWLDIGHSATCDFMTRCQRIVNNWLIITGHTISCADIVPSEDCVTEIKKIREDAQKAFDQAVEDFQDAEKIEKQGNHKAGKRIFDSFEVHINTVLNKLRGQAEKKSKDTIKFRYNQFNKMVWAGSKGKPTNLAQVMGLLGQQNIEGARIRNGFARRTLPHFQKEDNGIIARGFVLSNFFQGLEPYEFFFHTMGGREGLSDTAVKTSRTGYIQRKLVKALEDVLVRYDGTIRDSIGSLIQTCYGEDSLAGEYIETQKIAEIEYSNEQFEKEYRFIRDFENQVSIKEFLEREYERKLNKDVISEIDESARQSRQKYEPFCLEEEYRDLLEARDLFRKCFYFYSFKQSLDLNIPVNIDRMLRSTKIEMSKNNRIYDKDESRLSPIYVYRVINELFTKLDNDAINRGVDPNALMLFKAHVRLHLSSKKIVIKHKINKEKFEQLVREVEARYKQAIAHPGETIGAIAAQSVGEPTTQMTLNTFHFAGVSDRNVTLGVPRLQEILDASKNIKTPEVTIFFERKLEKPEDKQEMREQIEYQQVFKYIESTKILYDYEQEEIFDDEESQQNPWKLIIQFDKQKLAIDLYDKLYSEIAKLQNQLKFTASKSTYTQCFITIQYRENSNNDENSIQMQQQDNKSVYIALLELEKKIREIYIGGIQGVDKIYPAEKDFVGKWDTKTGKKVTDKETIFKTSGTNLKKIIKIDGVDSQRTYSNDIQEIAKVIGIEAARKSIINEIREVIEPYDIYINYRHLSILADWMTLRGRITPINRNGINRIPGISCLRKSSFEETVEILNSAAIFFEKDKLTGVTENIIFGQNCDIGTGSFELLIDQMKVQDFKTKREADYDNIPEQSPMSEAADYFNTPVNPNTPGVGMMTPGFSVHNIMGNFTPSTPNQGFSPFITSTPNYPQNNPKSPSQIAYARSSQISPKIDNSPQIVSPNYTPHNSTPAERASPYSASPNYKIHQGQSNSPAYIASPNMNSFARSPNYQSPHQNTQNAMSSSPQNSERSRYSYQGSVQSPIYNTSSSPQYDIKGSSHIAQQIKGEMHNIQEENESGSESESRDN